MRRVVLNLRDDRPAWGLPDDAAAAIAAAFPAPEWDVVDVRAPVSGRGDGGGVSDEALAAVAGAEVWIGYGFSRPLVDRMLEDSAGVSALRWIHSAAAGVRSMLHPELVAADVVITNSAGVHADPIAETVVGALHYFARGFDFAVRAQARREWGRELFDQRFGAVRELSGAALGILGYGGIGRALARRAIALGMRVTALRTGPRPAEDGVTMVHGDDGLDALLRASGYVVLALPSTAETHQLLDARRLGLLHHDAVIVNVGRGDTIDEAALARALAAGALRGAALDVFEHEPLPPTSPLWPLENVLILPHVSATTPRFWERETRLIVENAGRYRGGVG
ncbi:MAG: NAD(P)-dependent oxidoreductase, partial [Longimicrobiales bacterium]